MEPDSCLIRASVGRVTFSGIADGVDARVEGSEDNPIARLSFRTTTGSWIRLDVSKYYLMAYRRAKGSDEYVQLARWNPSTK